MEDQESDAAGALEKSMRAILSFMKVGVVALGFFIALHLSSCYIIAWILGTDFSTVVYVVSASVIMATLLTFTIAFLVTLNIALTAITGLTRGAQSMFGGGLGGSSSNQGLIDPFAQPTMTRTTTTTTNARYHSNNHSDADAMKLD